MVEPNHIEPLDSEIEVGAEGDPFEEVLIEHGPSGERKVCQRRALPHEILHGWFVVDAKA